jgi:DNA-binding MarR family transcriptional regulator
MIDKTLDTEYIILENIYDSDGRNTVLRQRDLALIAGASLGMTNSILKRLAQKGWITIRKLNNRNIQYAVTLEGMNEMLHRSYRYFKRTIKNIVYYKDALEDIVRRAGNGNITAVVLIGDSDLDFIVEHACRKSGLRFIRAAGDENGPAPGAALRIYSENREEKTAEGLSADTVYLSRLLTRRALKATTPP